MGSTTGEVICDSILQNKQKTKSYWEQLMMAAVTSEELGRTSHHTPDGEGSSNTMKDKDLLNLGGDGEDSKVQSELSKQELNGVDSQRSLSPPSQALHIMSNGTTAPKVVKSVAKKVFSEVEAIETQYDNTNDDQESVIEREIRLQKSKEEAVAKERQEALLRVAVTSQQTYAHETPQQQNKHGWISKNSLGSVLPNAETKIALELREMRRREEELKRQRQKLLMSNGTAQIKDSDQTSETVLNRIPNTDEENCSEYDSAKKELIVNGNDRNQKETPIEREIRLASEREEEFRQEKRLFSLNALPPVVPPTAPEVVCADDVADCCTVDREQKIKKCASTSHIPSVIMQMGGGTDTSRPAVGEQHKTMHFPINQKSLQNTSILMGSRKFPNSQRQKGLMQRFIASRGKINGTTSSIVSSSPVTPQNLSPSTPPYKATDILLEQASQYCESDKEALDRQRSQIRRGHVSAEKKIQAELLEMQKREEELRLQRASLFAQSQPNLLCMVEDDNDNEETSGAVDTQNQLRSSLSNPNLLDSETYLAINDDLSLKKPSGKTARRRSALIAQWENRIQQFTEQ